MAKLQWEQEKDMGSIRPKRPNTTFFGIFQQKKHYFENKWQNTTFSRTRVSKTRVPHQFCHRGTAELKFVGLKKIMWYSSLVNSSTMQHNTRVYQARVPLKKKKKIYTILEFGKLEYCVIFFFFWDNQQINIKIKKSSFFYVFIYLNRSIVKYRDFNFET